MDRPEAGRPFVAGLSVVIPCYGRPEALRRAVDSVRTAVPDRAEIIVVDDASPVPLAKALGPSNASSIAIRVIRLKTNGGPQTARNMGIRRAKFSHIAFLDSDDTFHPEKLDIVLAHLDESAFDILFHAVENMPRERRIASLWKTYLRGILPFHWLLAFLNPVPTPALVIRRSGRLGVPGMRYCEDYAFLLHYAQRGQHILYLDRVLSAVERRQGDPGGLSAQSWQMRRGEFRARRVLLRSGRQIDLVRWLIGSAIGSLRVVSDILRGRYWR